MALHLFEAVSFPGSFVASRTLCESEQDSPSRDCAELGCPEDAVQRGIREPGPQNSLVNISSTGGCK